MKRLPPYNDEPAPAPARPRPPQQHRWQKERAGQIRARFDAQFTTDDNRRHWAMADAMSIDASASWQVRRTLRMRSRYEYHNNSYYFGIADTIGNYVIGTGPRLQMLTPNKGLNVKIEKAWGEWAKEVRLPRTLKSMRVARLVNGESFSLLRTNPGLDNPVKLDVFEVEADQVSSPLFGLYPAQYPDQFFDGVVLDPWGRPQTYHVLRQHPGAFGAFVLMGYEFDPWPARYVLHDYKLVRPGQQRGIPESLPSLPLFAELRRYTLASVAAAETAADYAMAIQSDAPADPEGAAADPEAMDTFELKRRMATVLPGGWKLAQTKAEHPTTTYDTFVWALLREICRCMNLPVVFAGLDAAKANMSSAYVITQPFAKSVEVDRQGYDLLLDRVLDEFLTEAVRVPGLLPKDLPEEFAHQWFWPSVGNHADPAKVASAQETQLGIGTTTIPREFAARGLDWEAEQIAAAKSLGVSLVEYRAMLRQKMFAIRGQPSPAAVDPEPDPVEPTDQTEPTDDDEADEDQETG